MTLTKILKTATTLVLAATFSLSSLAQGLTPEQIARFGSMSSAEQQRLAKQLGIDIPKGGKQQQSQELPQTIEKATQGETRKFEPKASDDDGLPLFGYDVFAGEPTSFTPIADLPVPSDYVVGPGDEISVQLYGKENEQHLLTVGRDGFINMPKLGPISVAGKAFSQVRDDLTLRIKKQIIGADVAVGMGELRLMQVYVLGDANRPGAYNISSLATVTQAIIAAGGVAETGSLRQMEVRRGGKLAQRVDLYDLLINGDKSSDIRLQSGDAIFIHPVAQRVAIDGEVLRPAIYELKGNTSLAELVAIAGGVTPSGSRSGVQIKRLTDRGVDVITQNLGDPSDARFTLSAGDQVLIQARAANYANAITLSGAFVQGGRHGFEPGMRVLDVLTTNALRDDADLDIAVLVSEDSGKNTTVRYVKPKDVLQNPAHNTNYTLAEGDELIVLPGTDFMRCSADDLYSKQQKDLDEQALDNVATQFEAANERGLIISEQSGAGTKISEQRGDKTRTSEQRGDENRSIDLQQELSRQQQFARLQKKKLALKREHCGLRARYNTSLDIQRYIQQDIEERLTEDKSTTRLSNIRDEAFTLLGEERKALLAPTLAKLRLQARGGAVQQIVEVRGEVKFPGVYPYAPGMALDDLLAVAGGTLESTYQPQGELTRLKHQNGRIGLEHSEVAVAGPSLVSIKLQARDRVNVFQHPDWRNDLTVELAGEVRFPGRYAIQRGETLSDVIERAGGLTEFAFPAGSVLSRESLKEREQRQLERLRRNLKQEVASLALQKNSPTSGLGVSPIEAIQAVEQLDTVEALGRLVINLPAAMQESQTHDIILEDNDLLHIPGRTNTVTVVGEVQYPSSHVYEEGLSYKDYLGKAGGPRERADKGRIYVIRANGEVVVPRQSWFGTRIAEGDTVVVPIDAQYTDKLSLFSAVSQILFQLGVAYDVIRD